MNVAIGMIISLFVHLLNPHSAALNTQTNIQIDVTPTETPSVTPSLTPSETITPTVTPTETVTPSATPSPKPTGIWNGIQWVPANIRAFFGLSNAANRHERNEDRFEQKHGPKPTHAVEPTETEENEE